MKKTIIIIITLLSFWACEKDEPKEELPKDKIVYYISNEGAYGYGNASLSLYYPEDKKMINKAFKNTNNRSIGDVLQSTYMYDGKLFMMVNASSKIEVAKAENIEELGVINNISLPRYMVAKNNKGYISSWGNGGQIKIIDTQNLTIIDSVETGTGPEKLLISNDKLIVCNGGGFTEDSTISVIDLNTHQLINNEVIGDIPMDIMEVDNQIWVLCKGKILYDDAWNIIGHSASKLVLLNSDFKKEQEYILFNEQHPSHFALSNDKKTLFIGGGYGFNGIYNFDLNSKTLNTNPISNESFYGLNSAEGLIYGFSSPDFSSSGKMIIMDESGNVENEMSVGVGPNGMGF